MYSITRDALSKLLAALSGEASLLVPARTQDGQTDFVAYDGDTQVDLQTTLTATSVKNAFFPQVEQLLQFRTQGKQLAMEQILPSEAPVIIFGLRACDARSLHILDRVFLQEPVDSYYAARRKHTLLIGLGCATPQETCFCHAFGIDAGAPDTDVRTWLTEDKLYWEPLTEQGRALTEWLRELLVQEADEESVVEQRERTRQLLRLLPLHDFRVDATLPQKEQAVFNSEIWERLSPACLSCCSCTYVCPTCHCYDIRDYQVDERTTERFRCWDSCMSRDFTKMAHGNPRKTRLERFRQRYMHKLVYFPGNNDGVVACVGCGRCLRKCPVHLNIVKVAKALEVSDDV
jgi:ferredoxin